MGLPRCRGGQGGWEPRSKGVGKSTGGGRREGGKWDSQGVEGDRGWEPRSKGGGKSTGGGRREGGKWDSQGVEGNRGVGTQE